MEQFIIIETLRQLHAEGQTLSSGATALRAMRDEVPLEQAEQVMDELKEVSH